jgi:hypothetical protein
MLLTLGAVDLNYSLQIAIGLFVVALLLGLESQRGSSRRLQSASTVAIIAALFIGIAGDSFVSTLNSFARGVGHAILNARNFEIQRQTTKKTEKEKLPQAEENPVNVTEVPQSEDGRLQYPDLERSVFPVLLQRNKQKILASGLPRYTSVYPRQKQIPFYDEAAFSTSRLIAIFTFLELGQWQKALDSIQVLRAEQRTLPVHSRKILLAHIVELEAIAQLEMGEVEKAIATFARAKTDMLDASAEQIAIDRLDINRSIAQAVAGQVPIIDNEIYVRLVAQQTVNTQELALLFWARALTNAASRDYQSAAVALDWCRKYQSTLFAVDPLAGNRIAIILGFNGNPLKTAPAIVPKVTNAVRELHTNNSGLRTRQNSLAEKPGASGLPRFTTVYPRSKQVENYDELAAEHSELPTLMTALELGQWDMAAKWADRLLQKNYSDDKDYARFQTHMRFMAQVTELRGISRLEQGYGALAIADFEIAIRELERRMASDVSVDHALINLAIAKALIGRTHSLDTKLLGRLNKAASENYQELSLYYLAQSLQDQLNGGQKASIAAFDQSLQNHKALSRTNPIAANRLASVLGKDVGPLSVEIGGTKSALNAKPPVLKPQLRKTVEVTPNQQQILTGPVIDSGPPRFTSVYPRRKQMPHYDEVARKIPVVARLFDSLETGQWKLAEEQAYEAMLKVNKLPPVRQPLLMGQLEELLAVAKLERGSFVPAIARFKDARSKLQAAQAEKAILDRVNLNLDLAQSAAQQSFVLDYTAYARFSAAEQENLQELVLFFYAQSVTQQRAGETEMAEESNQSALRFFQLYEKSDPLAAKRLAFVKKAIVPSTGAKRLASKAEVDQATKTLLTPPRTISYPIETMIADFETLRFQNYRFSTLKNKWDDQDWIGVLDFAIELESWLDRYPYRRSLLLHEGKTAKASLMHMRAVAHLSIGQEGRSLQLLTKAQEILAAQEPLSLEEIRVRLDLAVIYLASSTPSTTVTPVMHQKLLSSAQIYPLELALYYRHAALAIWYRDNKLAATHLASAKSYVPLVAKQNVKRAKQLTELLEKYELALSQ